MALNKREGDQKRTRIRRAKVFIPVWIIVIYIVAVVLINLMDR